MSLSEEMFPDGVSLVVGGSGGIGQAICKELVANGCNVVFTYHKNIQAAQGLIGEIEQQGGRACAVQLAIQDTAEVKQVIDRVAEEHGRIHSVVIATGSDIEQLYISELDPDKWRAVMQADVDGVFNIIHATLPHFRTAGGGSYVHISSAGLLRWADRDVLSIVPKAAIDSLIKGIAKEEGKYGIRANSIAIGVIETGIFLRLKEQSVFDKTWEDTVLASLALKYFGQPESVANLAVFLASDKAAYTTGQLIAVDGGYGI